MKLVQERIEKANKLLKEKSSVPPVNTESEKQSDEVMRDINQISFTVSMEYFLFILFVKLLLDYFTRKSWFSWPIY